MATYTIALPNIRADSIAYDNAVNGVLTLRSHDDCTLTNNVFPGWWGDATADDPTYISQWQDTATDDAGNQYQIIFEFSAVRYDEPEDDGWPWDADHIVAVQCID